MTGRQFDNGMSALFRVYRSEIGVAMPTISGGMTKVYYLAAEEILWDYGPSGINNIDGTPLTSPGR